MVFKPIKVIDIELSRPLMPVVGLDSYAALQGLVRLHGAPIGAITMPLSDGCCTAVALAKAILDQHGQTLMTSPPCHSIAASLPSGGLGLDALVPTSPVAYSGPLPLVTVAVCTRDRTAELDLCLAALTDLDYPTLDLLLVDNAPSNNATARLVHASYPGVRYVHEPRPGLNWARNRAILEARGEIIAFTDDDVVVDPGWVRALACTFAAHPEVMVVTGLVVPYELETEAQLFFEWYGGFGKGYNCKWYRLNPEHRRQETWHIAAWLGGTGANMAYRRNLFEHIGAFDPALDVGTVTHGGGDLEMFFRVLQEGYTLVYEPNAVVRHRHRRTYAELRRQITTWGIGFYAYLVRSALMYPSKRLAIIRFGLEHLWRRYFRRLLLSLRYPTRFPRDLIVAELCGSFVGLIRYQKARRLAAKIAQTFGPFTPASVPVVQE